MFRLSPLLRLAALRPELLLDHLAGYADLLAAEAGQAGERLRRRLVWQLALGASLMLALALAGGALMLWAALPPGSITRPWLLVAVPLAPLLLAALAWRAAAQVGTGADFALLRGQAHADMQMLRQLHTEPGR